MTLSTARDVVVLPFQLKKLFVHEASSERMTPPRAVFQARVVVDSSLTRFLRDAESSD
jgi:hypothetical protein